jgi:hypothetical protein
VRRLVIGLILAAVTAGCTAQASRPAATATTPAPPPDPHTTAALLQIATAFNNNYDTGRYGATYDRWDARSQAIITRADYIKRHTECPAGPRQPAWKAQPPGPAAPGWCTTTSAARSCVTTGSTSTAAGYSTSYSATPAQ